MNIPKLGNTSKDSQYLARIKAAIKDEKSHPRNLGVAMQAHHIISVEGMKRSGYAERIKRFQYDINLLPNLVFLPCTLQGACHLGVQPHRGNHDHVIDAEDYDDDMEERSYHTSVSDDLQRIMSRLSNQCPGAKASAVGDVKKALDELSMNILGFIQNKPRDAPLTKIARHFNKGGVGCGGVDAIGRHSAAAPCVVDRKHLYDPDLPRKSQGTGQKVEKISFRQDGKYRLTPGR